MFERAKKSGDAVMIANTENSLAGCKEEKDALEIFKKDLGTYVRYYEFMSQIVDYDDRDLEKLSLYARHLRPMLREARIDEDEIDLGSVVLSHYRLSKIREQDLRLQEDQDGYELEPGSEAGSGRAKDKQEEFLSQIIARLNEVFDPEELTDKDMVSFLHSVGGKLSENSRVMNQMNNNTREQAMLGDFMKAVDDAIIDSSNAHENQKMQLLTSQQKHERFANLLYDYLTLQRNSPRE